MQNLGPEAVEATECHLLVCTDCRDGLVAIEPFSAIHSTEDGLFSSRITQRRDGTFWAHHWGCQIDGGCLYLDLSSARRYLLDSFVEMFPEHACGEACSQGVSAQHR